MHRTDAPQVGWGLSRREDVDVARDEGGGVIAESALPWPVLKIGSPRRVDAQESKPGVSCTQPVWY